MELSIKKGFAAIEKLRIRLFYFSAIFVVVGQLIDLFFSNFPKHVDTAAYFLIGLSVFIILLRYFNILNNIWANSIIIYFLVLDVMSTLFFLIGHEAYWGYFIRVSVLLIAIIPYAGFNVNKYHSIIVGSLFFACYIAISFLTGDETLIKGLTTIFIIEFAYVVGIYLLIHNLILVYSDQEELLKETESMNSVLLEREKELKDAIDSKNSLFSIISHDLRNPFNTIIGFIDLFERAIEKNDIEKMEKYHPLLKTSASNAYFLIRNLFDWAKIQKEKGDFIPAKFNFYSMIDEVMKLASSEASRKKISISSFIPKEHDIVADKNMIAAVMRNLISNAIKFTPNKGEIMVGIQSNGKETAYFVKDSGVGVPEEKLKTMFSGLHIESEPGTLNEKGSGLGLSICTDFIAKHKGRIWAEKNEGIGITVFFTVGI